MLRHTLPRWGGLVAVLAGLCVLLRGAAGGDADTWTDEDEATAVTLLEPLIGPCAATLEIDSVRPAKQGADCWLVAGWLTPSQGEPKARLNMILDCDRSLICSLLGAPLSPVEGDTPEARLEAAEAFARQHLGPCTDQTQLVEQADTAERFFYYTWANVLPSGAWTGDWWKVTVHAVEGAISGFFQQRAYRQVAEDDVRIDEDAARRAVARGVRGRGDVEVTDSRLILSHPRAPEYGPLWFITFRVGETGAPREWVVDAVTGRRLAQ